jgi:hypothetical protein
MAASEFCSEAHRREYQQEYSELALGRLLQSNPAGSQAQPLQPQPLKVPQLATASAPADNVPAVNGMPASARPSAAPLWAETAHSPATPSVPAATTNGIAKPHPPSANPATTAASEPPAAKPAVTQKPAPAELDFVVMAAHEFEHALASLAPIRPRRLPDPISAELPRGRAVSLESRVEIADSIARPLEHKLELREVSRTTPRIVLDLHAVPPESLETERRPLPIPVAPVAPAEASLWIGPHRDFAGELVCLSGFANDQFSKSDFEAPAVTEGSVLSAVPEPLPPTERTHAIRAEIRTAAPISSVRVPDPQLIPLPVSSTGIAPGTAKPLPVFGPVAVSTGAVQIPQPTGLPLRPVMVLATATAIAPATEVKDRKTDIPSPRSVLSIKPELQPSTTSAALSPELNLGLPELRMEAPAGVSALRMRKILAAVAGAAVLGAGILFFATKQGDAGSKSPAPLAADGAAGGQWIANFAPDARRQRRVSVLRSSIALPAYRLEFESSIRIKALGWVYRAQDSKNFYVSKIEFQKPGVNPVYALVRYAVINGVEQPRVETPLHVSVPMGGLYKIRFEAVGSRFTTWVQGQQVEQWTDPRLSSGGAGLYGEGVEQSILQGDFVVTPLSN